MTAPDAWNGRAVLVTGATGFIGGAAAARLARLGARVHGTSRRETAAPSFEMHACDLGDFGACDALVRRVRPEIILHLAGHPFASRDLERVAPTFRDNLQTTASILTAAARAGTARVVLPGSLEEPDNADDAASSPYAVSKWAASQYARLFHTLYQLPVTTARLFMVYGPGQRDLKKLIPGTIASLLRREPPRISSGERPVDWVFIDDVVDGLLAAALAPDAAGRTVDVGTGTLTTVRTVVETLAALVPGSPAPNFGVVPARPNEQVRAANTAQSRDLTGWSPRVKLRDGLARTIEWVKSMPAGSLERAAS